ncbi:MAG TPA: hypothetical protein VF614_13555, partial [Chthoniobacteraceae bacterium]
MKTWQHLIGVALAAVAIGLLFLREPGFGDDLTYWSFAFDLHERGLVAWQVNSFHDLRWPVWGVSWVLQGIFGPGLVAYYGVPLLYLAAGAMLSFVFGRKLTASVAAGWGCAIAFVFHPLLDSVAYRPMPDLSEGVWGAAVMLAWWGLMHAETSGRRLLLAILTGAAVFLAESNRITGVFIIPVFVVATLLYYRAKFAWLIPAGLVAIALYAGEAYFYHQLFGDWLHNLHANMGARGVKGTESIPLWYLPFRFFDTLWKGNPLAPFYCIFALIGIVAAWRRHGVLGRVLVLWFGILYLEYSCGPQSLWPWRPLIRDADRFLCGLTVPMSVLAMLGAWTLVALAARSEKLAPISLWTRRPALIGIVATLLLTLVTTRNRFDMGFIPEFRRYMATIPDGTKIFSHKPMREITHLVDATAARRFDWYAPNAILHRDPKIEARALECDEFWYARKLVWLNTRKQLERKKIAEPLPLASFFESPERDWRMAQLLAKGDTPDLIFYRRRTAETPAPLILEKPAAEWEALTRLPASWTAKGHDRTQLTTIPVPPDLRGKLTRFEMIAASEQVEALTVRLRFTSGKTLHSEYLLKPYLHPQPTKEFFAMQIPLSAEECEVQMKFSRNAEQVNFTS